MTDRPAGTVTRLGVAAQQQQLRQQQQQQQQRRQQQQQQQSSGGRSQSHSTPLGAPPSSTRPSLSAGAAAAGRGGAGLGLGNSPLAPQPPSPLAHTPAPPSTRSPPSPRHPGSILVVGIRTGQPQSNNNNNPISNQSNPLSQATDGDSLYVSAATNSSGTAVLSASGTHATSAVTAGGGGGGRGRVGSVVWCSPQCGTIPCGSPTAMEGYFTTPTQASPLPPPVQSRGGSGGGGGFAQTARAGGRGSGHEHGGASAHTTTAAAAATTTNCPEHSRKTHHSFARGVGAGETGTSSRGGSATTTSAAATGAACARMLPPPVSVSTADRNGTNPSKAKTISGDGRGSSTSTAASAHSGAPAIVVVPRSPSVLPGPQHQRPSIQSSTSLGSGLGTSCSSVGVNGGSAAGGAGGGGGGRGSGKRVPVSPSSRSKSGKDSGSGTAGTGAASTSNLTSNSHSHISSNTPVGENASSSSSSRMVPPLNARELEQRKVPNPLTVRRPPGMRLPPSMLLAGGGNGGGQCISGTSEVLLLGESNATVTAAANSGNPLHSNSNTISSSSVTGGAGAVAAESAEAQFEDELQRVFDTFVHHLPDVWAKPLLRAVTLQTITGRVPPRVISTTFTISALTDLAGEMRQKRVFKQAPATSSSITSTNAVNNSANGGVGGNGQGPCSDGHTFGNNISGNYTNTDTNSAQSSPPLGPLPSPQLPTPLTMGGNNCLDMCRLLVIAPSLLRFKINSMKEQAIAARLQSYEHAKKQQEEDFKLLQQKQQQHDLSVPAVMLTAPIVVPQRSDVAVELFRPSDGDVQFGALLAADVTRLMVPGSRLFLPPTSTATGHSSVLLSSPFTSPQLGPTPSPRIAAAALTPQPIAFSASAMVSFELMPSIFVKSQLDARQAADERAGPRPSHRSSARRRTGASPFFEREFVATFAVGNPASSLFATTLAPEFLVGLNSFISHPQRSTASAVRGTLHRMYLVLTTEVLRRDVVSLQPHRKHAVRAPPVDLAIAYLRESTLCFAATAGIGGRLFYLSSSAGRSRLVADLELDFTHAEKGLAQLVSAAASEATMGSTLDTSAKSASMLSCVLGQGNGNGSTAGTYDMPVIGRGTCDLHQFHAAVELLTAGRLPQYPSRQSIGALSTPRSSCPRVGASSLPLPTSISALSGAIASSVLLPGMSTHTIPPLLPVLRSYWTPERLREKQAKEVELPLVAVLATTEFWQVMPTALVADLLRVLLLLSKAAATFTMDRWHTLRRHAREGAHRHGNTAGRVPPKDVDDEEETVERQTQRVRQYVRSLKECFPDSVLANLERFYDARMSFHSVLYESNTQTPQDKLDAQLAATARRNKEAQQQQQQQQTHPQQPLSSVKGPESSLGSNSLGRPLMPPLDAVDQDEANRVASLLTKPPCDAIAAFLSSIAVEHGQAIYREEMCVSPCIAGSPVDVFNGSTCYGALDMPAAGSGGAGSPMSSRNVSATDYCAATTAYSSGSANSIMVNHHTKNMIHASNSIRMSVVPPIQIQQQFLDGVASLSMTSNSATGGMLFASPLPLDTRQPGRVGSGGVSLPQHQQQPQPQQQKSPSLQPMHMVAAAVPPQSAYSVVVLAIPHRQQPRESATGAAAAGAAAGANAGTGWRGDAAGAVVGQQPPQPQPQPQPQQQREHRC